VKILVIAAAGRTGRHVLEQAVARGHTVTAFARRPGNLAEIDGVHAVVAGDATDTGAVRGAVQGQDAVILAVGSSAIVRTLLPVMAEAGVTRVVMTSSRSVVATRPRLLISLVWLVFRGPYADLARAEGMLEGSGLDWSVVRATMLDDGSYTGRVHTDFEPNATGGHWKLRRADYAMALLDAVEDSAMVRQAIGVCGSSA
jgi:putative NADH-flavin reductase